MAVLVGTNPGELLSYWKKLTWIKDYAGRPAAPPGRGDSPRSPRAGHQAAITTTEMWLAAPMTSTGREGERDPHRPPNPLRPRRPERRSRHRGFPAGRDRGMRRVPAGHGRGRRGALVTGTAISGTGRTLGLAGRTLGLAGRRPGPPDRVAGGIIVCSAAASVRYRHAERRGPAGARAARPRRTAGAAAAGAVLVLRWPRARGACRRGAAARAGRRRRGGNPLGGVPPAGAERCCHQGWPAGTGGKGGAAAGCLQGRLQAPVGHQSGCSTPLQLPGRSSTWSPASAASCFRPRRDGGRSRSWRTTGSWSCTGPARAGIPGQRRPATSR